MDVVITKKGLLESNVIVGTALLCGFLVEALNMLKRLPLQNIVSWTALISRYVYVESHILEAIYLLINSNFDKISELYFVADTLFETNGRICCYKKKKGKKGNIQKYNVGFCG